MDKLMNNHWVMKIIALLLALMLYLSVNIDNPTSPKQPPVSPLFPTASTDTATLTDIPVRTYFDQENLVVTGVPETVNVTLEGPTNSLVKARQLKDFEIFAELTELNQGTHRIELRHKNVAEDLDVSINPSVVTVSVQEKVTRDFPVEVDFINQSKMKEGYTTDQPIVQPNVVRVTGAREVIEKISTLKARVNLQDAEETVKEESKVTVYDRDGNILPLEIDPTVVDVTVPITSPSKSVPFKIARKGELPEGLSISSIEPNPNEVTVYGPQDVIDQLEFIDGVEVDLSKIKEDTVLKVDVPVPDGAKAVSPKKLEINIDVDEDKEKVIQEVPIQTIGLGEEKDLEFVEPAIQTVDLNVAGAPSVIDELDASDIELFVNLADLGDGEHNVPIEVNGPQNVTWSLPNDEVKVKISSQSS
ncbi:CdaR family protein [Metabacillus arenae]|uniref:YbbR-like domain-containing protein n=1 Tax=Metabacillus arenae TaxID=2771434 RepID=A0A926NIS0_9BACI|nr:YbbR-like domain-containing protein [Metabacillus arenae]MBD1382464.1 YbbR-like domain-containing protein [Metabacillus arenae]